MSGGRHWRRVAAKSTLGRGDLTRYAVQAADDRFHAANESPYWNESSWMSLMIPEREIHGWIYFHHRPNMKMSVGGVALWDPSGANIHDCLFYRRDDCLALPDGADMFDFTLDNSLAVRTVEPLRAYHYTFNNNGLEVDVVWKAIMEPEAFPLNELLIGWTTDAGTAPVGHYDQAGRLRGTIVLDGERLEIDCYSMKDRSWGPRHSSQAMSGGYSWAIASESSYFCLAGLTPETGRADRLPDAPDSVLADAGWYMADGKLGYLQEGERRVASRGDDGRPLQEVLSARDHLGRSIEAIGRHRSQFMFVPMYNIFFMWWDQVVWEFDGQVAYGECQEWFPIRDFRYRAGIK